MAAKRADEGNKSVIFKNCVPFTNWKSEINNTELDNAKDIDVVMPMYNLIEYSDNYSRTSGSLWQYYKEEPNDNLADSESYKSKVKTIGSTPHNDNIKDIEVIVPWKYLSNFWRILETSLINCEVNLITNSYYYLIIFVVITLIINTNSTGAGKFVITDTELYVPVVTLITQDNTRLLQQLKSGFKRTINWNKYQSDPKTYAQIRYLNQLVHPSFQAVSRIFVLSFENEDDGNLHSNYCLPKVTIKYYNVMIGGKTFFDQTINSELKVVRVVDLKLTFTD